MQKQTKKRLEVTSIVDHYVRGGLTTAQIAGISNYSRQRVGQLLRAAGIDVKTHAHAKRQATLLTRARSRRKALERGKELERNEKISARKHLDEERYREWRLLWAKGETAATIAAFENRPLEAIKGAIRRLRMRYHWFKPRRKVRQIQCEQQIS